MERVDGRRRRRVHLALERHGLVGTRTLVSLRAIDRGGGRFPDSEERFEDSSGVAPQRRAHEGAHPCLLLGVCDVEDTQRLAEEGRPGIKPADDSRRDSDACRAPT